MLSDRGVASCYLFLGSRLTSFPLPLGGQTNLRIPQGTIGQVMPDERAYLVRWEYSYSSWALFTCEIEMLLHVVSTAGEAAVGRSEHTCGGQGGWGEPGRIQDQQG